MSPNSFARRADGTITLFRVAIGRNPISYNDVRLIGSGRAEEKGRLPPREPALFSSGVWIDADQHTATGALVVDEDVPVGNVAVTR